MPRPEKSSPKEYATLFLARAICEGSLPMARAAIEAGADPNAFWIDGRTKLGELARRRGLEKLDAYFTELAAPEVSGALRPYARYDATGNDHGVWSSDFVKFVARRGYDFRTFPGPFATTNEPPIKSAKSGVDLIMNRWHIVESITPGDEDGESHWAISFSTSVPDSRLPRHYIGFRVPATGVALLSQFKDPSESQAASNDLDPIFDKQKAWEGRHVMDSMLDRSYTLNDVVSRLRKGGNPFFTWKGAMLGDFSGDPPDIMAFMSRVRELCAPELGFHRRLAPLLEKKALLALIAASDIEMATGTAKVGRKTLAEGRKDTL
ncbi:hypothetical protein [Ramlibacter sp.]|uniref:hypothetical protein n=1 Tax=Ramlibacter sp. TaxID=1917967 RepID=UPI0018253C72|nr:hypothetical protein [Ramlibacter sp.]MBA2675564.1 hypothetical protein [Ramlibacter sp.]